MSKKIEDIFISTAAQKVLRFLSQNHDSVLYDSEIQRTLSTLSRASVNNSLRDLNKAGVTERVKKGLVSMNRLYDTPEMRIFKQ
ncbi:MAG: hypothetical protein V1647_03285, partial [Pseudomonadota bacterium]